MPLTLAAPHRLAQQELDLAVQAAQLIVGPALDRVEQLAVHTQEERLPFCHDYW